MPETVTFTIDGDDGSTDRLVIPDPLFDLLRTGEESPAEIIGDLAMLTCAQQAHAFVHHSTNESDEDVVAIEQATMQQFEERFGISYEEMTGHSH